MLGDKMENGYEYIVKEGDTLSEILYNMTGNGSSELYDKIAKDNNIVSADHIVPGQKIVIGNEYISNSSSSVEVNSMEVSRASQETADETIRTSSSTSQPKTELSSSNSTAEAESLIYESEDQSEFENLFSKGTSSAENKNTLENQNYREASTTNNNQAISDRKTELREKQETIAKSPRRDTINGDITLKDTSHQNSSNGAPTTTGDTVTSYYMPSDYEICYPLSVTGFSPRNSFKTFIIKKNAGEHFVAVNNQVKKCGSDIDGIISSLNTLKSKMGENTGTTSQIEKIVQGLADKKQDLINKNSELIEACYKVIEYVYENKESKSSQASEIYNTISQINLYKG